MLALGCRLRLRFGVGEHNCSSNEPVTEEPLQSCHNRHVPI